MQTAKFTLISAIIVLAIAIQSASAQHAGDVWVGRTSAGQLDAGGFIDVGVGFYLAPSGGLFPGWSDNDPGFDRVINDDPENDLYSLATGAQIRLEVVAFDPALRAVDTSFNILDTPGEQTILGGATLHTHLTWNINVNDPMFDDQEYVWEAKFRFVDTGSTGYVTSDDISLRFTNVDVAPGDVNEDGLVDTLDVPDFLALLFDDSTATREQRAAADINLDRNIDGIDLQLFVTALLSP
ncbi:MAG TPA: hypothetical protein P5081_20530 [Phycisphaerae bacterium]|nr:hypothetical protein [Phycisphaerae bacterium]HRW55266.1 hypothetical protein [Phycisphaerae bacterium]